MNYQYNQPQQPVMPQMPPPGYANPSEAKKKKKESFEQLSEKMAEFFGTNSFLSAVARGSDMVSYIVTCVFTVFTILLNIVFEEWGAAGAPELVMIFFGVLAVSKKTLLPLAIASSCATLTYCTTFFNSFIYHLSEIFSYHEFISAISVFSILVGLLVLCLLTGFSWFYFAAVHTSKPRMPMPVQNYQQPMQSFQQPPAQSFQQPPAQNYQQPPAQSFQQPPVQNYQQPPAQSFQQPPAQNFQQPPAQNFQQPPAQNFQQPPVQNFQQPPAQNFQQQPVDFPETVSLKQPPSDFPKTVGLEEAPADFPETVGLEEAPADFPGTESAEQPPEPEFPKTVSLDGKR